MQSCVSPHDWLFPRIDAACHHGGSGTTGASLKGRLLVHLSLISLADVVVAQLAFRRSSDLSSGACCLSIQHTSLKADLVALHKSDQFFQADRMEALGVGTCLRKLTVESLSRALHLATSDIKQIKRAQLIGQEIRKEDGVANAIEMIYRDMEYARTLVKVRILGPFSLCKPFDVPLAFRDVLRRTINNPRLSISKMTQVVLCRETASIMSAQKSDLIIMEIISVKIHGIT